MPKGLLCGSPLPHLDKDRAVDPGTRQLPLPKMEVAVDVVDLHSVDFPGAQPRLNIAVDLVCLAAEEARTEEEVGPQQAQVVELLRASRILHVEREAEERRPRHPNRLLP